MTKISGWLELLKACLPMLYLGFDAARGLETLRSLRNSSPKQTFSLSNQHSRFIHAAVASATAAAGSTAAIRSCC